MKFTDQTGRTIEIYSTQRVVSIVPSQSEFLIDIGLNERIVGVTKFCIHPKDLIQKVGQVGGTKNLNIQKIKELKPDLIIGNKEENSKEDIEALSEFCPVLLSDIYTFDDALNMMQSIGKLLGLEKESNTLIQEILTEKEKFSKSQFGNSCLYFIWKNPNMIVGSENFIHSMLELIGFKNLGASIGKRYPVLDAENTVEDPDFIFLSTEPFPFKESDLECFRKLFPNSKILLVDGEMFSWYGSRLIKSFNYFSNLQKRI